METLKNMGVLKTRRVFEKIINLIAREKLLAIFITTHVFFVLALGPIFAFAPDEVGYLFTFENVYRLPINTVAQTGSGWIAAPTIFLWILYFPAKLVNFFGLSSYLSIRFLAVLTSALSIYLLQKLLKDVSPEGGKRVKSILLMFFIPSLN